MKWKEVLSSVRCQCVYIGWRLEDIKSSIYKLSKYYIKMRHIQHRNLLSHFCKVVFWNRNVCKHNSSSPLFMLINGQFLISEYCWCYLFDQIKNIFCDICWLCNTENLTLSFINSAVYQGEIYAGLREVFELWFNTEVVQGNTTCTVQTKMWL